MNNEETFPRTVLGEAIRRAYRSGQEDEALEPLIVADTMGRPIGRIGKNDGVIFYDIRGEREVEITRSLVETGFARFPTAGDLNLHFTTLIEYAPALPVRIAFPPEGKIRNTLAEVIGRAGLSLLKIAESEKAAHIGFFLNGKNDEFFPGEDRIIIPSPEGVANYDQAPEMSVSKVAAAIEAGLTDDVHDVIIANFANVDVVGHIENREAAVRAVESVDAALGQVVEAARRTGSTLLVTADHGTVEEWLYPDGTINTGHTKNPVPFILADFSSALPQDFSLRDGGELADVAPTILDLLGLLKPDEMTGVSLRQGGSSSAATKAPSLPEGISAVLARGFRLRASTSSRRKVALLILDGWGRRPADLGNLIAAAATPHFEALWASFPHTSLQAAGEAVGMPPGTVGNSEAGHLHIGSGRRVLLDRVRIDRAVADGSFFQNEAFLEAMRRSKTENRPLHLMGIISHYSSHGTIRHLFALLEAARRQGVGDVFIHGFLGRRGERPESGALYVEKVEAKCHELGLGQVVTVLGRYWSLDREENWGRIEKAYRALVFGSGEIVRSVP